MKKNLGSEVEREGKHGKKMEKKHGREAKEGKI